MSVFSDCSGQVLVWVGELRSPRFPFVCAVFFFPNAADLPPQESESINAHSV